MQIGSVCTRAEARRAGFGDAAISRRVASGQWQAPFRGVLVRHACPLTLAERALAAVRSQVAPAWASHQTAGALWRLDLPRWAVAEPVHLTLSPTRGRHRAGLRLHTSIMLGSADTCGCDGVPVTSPARTAADLARVLPRLPAVIAADSVLRAGLCRPGDLRAVVHRLGGHRGVRVARDIVALSDEWSASVPETTMRMTLVDSGLPRPVANHDLRDGAGAVLARGDLVYDTLLVWLEYDGYDGHVERRAFEYDRQRERMLVARGWEVLRFTAADLRRPYLVVRDVREALVRAPARIRGLDPGRSPEVARARRAALLPLPVDHDVPTGEDRAEAPITDQRSSRAS